MGKRKIKLISATQDKGGYIYYFVEYYGEGGNAGKKWWSQDRMPEKLQTFFRENEMVDCCLGLGEKKGEVNYVARSTTRIMFQLPQGSGQKEKPSDYLAGYDFCSIGVGGAFCLRKGEKMLYSPLGEDKMGVVRELEKDGKLKGMYFGGAGLVLRHQGRADVSGKKPPPGFK